MLKQGICSIEKKQRYTYDAYGNLTQYYVEAANSYTKNYEYTNTYDQNQLIHAHYDCMEYGDPGALCGRIRQPGLFSYLFRKTAP